MAFSIFDHFLPFSDFGPGFHHIPGCLTRKFGCHDSRHSKLCQRVGRPLLAVPSLKPCLSVRARSTTTMDRNLLFQNAISPGCCNNGPVFIQSWRAETLTLNFREKNPSFSQNDFGKFLRGGYPNRSSEIHRWGWDLSTGCPNTYFSWFSGYPQLTLVFLLGDEKFRIFSWGACREIRVSGSQHQLRVKTVPSFEFSLVDCLSLLKSEKSAQRGFFWDEHPADIRGSFARISRPKTSVIFVPYLVDCLFCLCGFFRCNLARRRPKNGPRRAPLRQEKRAQD